MKRKLLPVLFCIVFIISAFTAVGVSAASKTQDGIEASLSFSKTEYSANESIGVTLTVKNTNTAAVDVQTEIVLPGGVSLLSGSLKQSSSALAAGATKTNSVTLTKYTASGSVQTGDGDVLTAVALMLISGAAFLLLAVKNRWIRGKGFLSLLICFAMLGTAVLPMAVSADSKQLTVEETLKLDGESKTVKAIVTYGAQGEVGGSDNTDSGASGNNGGASDPGSAGSSGNAGGSENAGNNGSQNGGSANSGGDVTGNTGDDTTSETVGTTNPEGEEILGEGSEATPYMEIPNEDMTVTTVAIPAGGVLYYDIYRVGGMVLTINDANAYVEYNGTRYDAQNGTVSFRVENALASDSVSFAFGNNGSADTSFTVIFTNPTGTYQNPTVIETMGAENHISLEEDDEVGHYYKYYAEKAGTIRFYLTASVDSIIVVTNNRNSAQRSTEADPLTDEQGNTYIELEVEEGDELIITVGAKPNKRGKYPAADITWSGNYN